MVFIGIEGLRKNYVGFEAVFLKQPRLRPRF